MTISALPRLVLNINLHTAVKLRRKGCFMRLHQLVAFLVFFSCGTGALANSTSDEFDVHVKGFKAGRLSLTTRTKGTAYAARILLRTTGLAAKILRYSFEATVRGRSDNGHNRPDYYSEKSDTGKRQTDKTISYVNGLANVTQSKSRKPHWLRPKGQRNRLDPLTATYELLRNRPKATLCQQSFKLFDGARAVDIILTDTKTSGTGHKHFVYLCSFLFSRFRIPLHNAADFVQRGPHVCFGSLALCHTVGCSFVLGVVHFGLQFLKSSPPTGRTRTALRHEHIVVAG